GGRAGLGPRRRDERDDAVAAADERLRDLPGQHRPAALLLPARHREEHGQRRVDAEAPAPALEEAAAAPRLLVLDPGPEVEVLEADEPLRTRLEMDDDAVRHVADAEAGGARGQAELEVLVTVHVRLVGAGVLLAGEPTGGGEHLQVAR